MHKLIKNCPTRNTICNLTLVNQFLGCFSMCADMAPSLSIFLQLLERVFNIMREKNPTMVGGQKKKLVMKPPQVVRVGAKKTSFVNFTDICKLYFRLYSWRLLFSVCLLWCSFRLHRQPKHLLAFLMSELGTR